MWTRKLLLCLVFCLLTVPVAARAGIHAQCIKLIPAGMSPEQFAREIISSNGEAATFSGRRFDMTRGSSEFAHIFGEFFVQKMTSLGPRAHVIDAGAGNLLFSMELSSERQVNDWSPAFLRKPLDERPLITAIAKDLPFNAFEIYSKPVPSNVHLQLHEYFEDVDIEKLMRRFGAADVITDYLGVTAYTFNIGEVMRRYWTLLKPGGYAFINRENLNGEIILEDGRSVSMETWVRNLPGFEVVETGAPYALVLKKIEMPAGSVIPVTVFNDIKGGHPPWRQWRY